MTVTLPPTKPIAANCLRNSAVSLTHKCTPIINHAACSAQHECALCIGSASNQPTYQYQPTAATHYDFSDSSACKALLTILSTTTPAKYRRSEHPARPPAPPATTTERVKEGPATNQQSEQQHKQHTGQRQTGATFGNCLR